MELRVHWECCLYLVATGVIHSLSPDVSLSALQCTGLVPLVKDVEVREDILFHASISDAAPRLCSPPLLIRVLEGAVRTNCL